MRPVSKRILGAWRQAWRHPETGLAWEAQNSIRGVKLWPSDQLFPIHEDVEQLLEISPETLDGSFLHA